jgi:hypothetical protein
MESQFSEGHGAVFTRGGFSETCSTESGLSHPGNSINSNSPAVSGMLKGIQLRRRNGSRIEAETV